MRLPSGVTTSAATILIDGRWLEYLRRQQRHDRCPPASSQTLPRATSRFRTGEPSILRGFFQRRVVDRYAGSLFGGTTPTTSGLISQWKGESNANDSVDGNNGTLPTGAQPPAPVLLARPSCSMASMTTSRSTTQPISNRLISRLESWVNFSAADGSTTTDLWQSSRCRR